MIRGRDYDLILAGSIMPDSRRRVNQKNETNGRGDIFDTPGKKIGIPKDDLGTRTLRYMVEALWLTHQQPASATKLVG